MLTTLIQPTQKAVRLISRVLLLQINNGKRIKMDLIKYFFVIAILIIGYLLVKFYEKNVGLRLSIHRLMRASVVVGLFPFLGFFVLNNSPVLITVFSGISSTIYGLGSVYFSGVPDFSQKEVNFRLCVWSIGFFAISYLHFSISLIKLTT